MECPLTPVATLLIEEDAIPLDQSIEMLISFDDTCSDTTCWVPWNRLEGVNSYFSDLNIKRMTIEVWVCAQELV